MNATPTRYESMDTDTLTARRLRTGWVIDDGDGGTFHPSSPAATEAAALAALRAGRGTWKS